MTYLFHLSHIFKVVDTGGNRTRKKLIANQVPSHSATGPRYSRILFSSASEINLNRSHPLSLATTKNRVLFWRLHHSMAANHLARFTAHLRTDSFQVWAFCLGFFTGRQTSCKGFTSTKTVSSFLSLRRWRTRKSG